MFRPVNIDPAALRDRRIRKGHTTHSLAELSGVSQQRISELEGDPPVGVRPPTAKALADALGCDIADITDLVEATAR